MKRLASGLVFATTIAGLATLVACVARECSRLVNEGILSREDCHLLIQSAAGG